MKRLPSLKQMEYLVALTETCHFGKASELCNVTPSTLSAGIQDMERILNIPLAERTKRTVLMTPLGRDIAQRARLVLRDAEDLMNLAARQQNPMTGEMKLGVIPTISQYLFPRVLPTLNAMYPELRLYLYEETTEALLAKLQAGDIDVGLIALPYETDDLVVRELFEDEFCFSCHADHPLAGRKRIFRNDFANQPLLLLQEDHCLRAHALDACLMEKGQIQLQFEATSLNAVVGMVTAGLGVTLLPQLAIDANVTAGTKIKLIPLAEKSSRQIALVCRPSSLNRSDFELMADVLCRL